MRATERSRHLPVRDRLAGVPVDLVALVAYLLVADAVLVGLPGGPRALQTLVGLPLVFFVPGYAAVAALFPATPTDGDRRGGLGLGERALFAVGLSIALVIVLALALSAAGVGFGRLPVLAGLSTLTVVGATVGAVRRYRLPAGARFRLPIGRWVDDLASALSGRRALVNGVLAVAVVLAVASVSFAAVAPADGESYTGFALLTESEGGDLVASDYPTNFTVGEPRPVVLSVENHEDRRVAYTVVALIQRVDASGDAVTVREERELRRVETTVADGERWRGRLPLSPAMTGDDLRLQFLLYRGDAPADPSARNAYHDLHLWVNVSEGPTG